ncbi:3-oxoadipate enol-lactonase [Mycobacterium sp. NPDC003323]
MPLTLHHNSDGPPDAPVLVLSGGLGTTTAMWEPNLPALAPHFRVIRLDHRGHGRSPDPSEAFTVADLADDVEHTLDGLRVNRFAWCGLSLGGMVGLELATRIPERLTHLVLCCTSARITGTEIWRQRIGTVTERGIGSIAEAVVDRWFTPDWAHEHPDIVRTARGWVTATPDPTYCTGGRAILAWDHTARLNEVVTPTLVIAAKHDNVTPVNPDAMALAEGIRQARLHIANSGHLATFESAADVNAVLLQFLSETSLNADGSYRQQHDPSRRLR